MTTTLPSLSEINLDCEDQRTLELLAHGFDTLKLYAMAKAEAQYERSAGRITEALACEVRCENYYHQIPANWRW
jgi:hypothetical protein